MRLASLFSGGKDSTYSLFKAVEEGHDIRYLVTIIPEKQDSWMFHHPCVELTKLQAECMGIKQLMKKAKGEKEGELHDLRETLSEIRGEIDGVVTGAIASTYQKSRIEMVCRELGLHIFNPLWQKDPEMLMREELDSGFEIIITGVFAEGFNKNWLGRRIDDVCIGDLRKLNERYGINIAGEGGEFETFVIDCPLFKKRIEIDEFDIIWDGKTSSGYIKVKDAKLIQK
jgi:ABC transporter with metal-binding/Fe-S-binding domain ATP-binding protein